MQLERGIVCSYYEPKNPISSTISIGYKERFAKFGISVSYEPMANIRPFRLSSFFLYSYFKGLDNLIATARSNKVAVVLGFQDFSQLKRDYGDKEAAVIMSTVGNVFSGQVVGETAKTLSERFGKILQKRESMSINRNDTSTSINTQLDSLIPASKISTLSQGMFVGAVADNFGETIEQKIFHAQIVVDNEVVQKETAAYQPIPEISSFLDENGNDTMEQQIQANYRQIKQDIVELVENELIRIENDPELKHLLGGNEI